GTSAFLGLAPIATFTHHCESFFNRFREGELRCCGARADLSLRALDMLNALLRQVEVVMSEGPPPLPLGYVSLLETLIHPEDAGILVDAPSEARASTPTVVAAKPETSDES